MLEEYQKNCETEASKMQRNFFVGLVTISLLTNFCLAIKLASISEKIIMVPGIAKELVIEGEKVSKNYLEETSLLFISALLDLTPSTIDAKREIIVKNASRRSADAIKQLQNYFAKSSIEHKKFGLSTFFTPKKLIVDTKNLQVIVEGRLTSTFGKKGFNENEVKYRLSFDYVAGHLQIKEFVKLGKDLKREKKDDE